MAGVIVPLPPNEVGRPDYIYHHKRMFVMELKTEQGRLSDAQERHRKRFLEMGVPYYIPRTPEEVIEAFHQEGLTGIRIS